MIKDLKTKKLFWLTFLLLISLSGVSCLDREEEVTLHVKELSSPSLLPGDLTHQKVYFVKNENDKSILHITNIGRSDNEQVVPKTEGNNFTLSPLSRNIAFDSSKKINDELRSGIWIYDLNNNYEENIVLWPNSFFKVSLSSPYFFPDEKTIIFDITWYEKDKFGLGILDLENDSLEILDKVSNIGISPVVSPDGSKILTLCAGMDRDSHLPGFQLCIMNSDGTDHKILTHNGDSHGSYLFTPDNKHIVYTETETGGLLKIREKPYQRVYITDLEGSQHRKLLDFRGAVRAISADGEDIILEGTPGEPYPWSIYLLSIDGMDLRHLSYFDDFLAKWYPKDD